MPCQDYQHCFEKAISETSTNHQFGQRPFNVARLLQSIPKGFDDEETFLLSKLLRWAELAKTQQALEVLNLAHHGSWQELLHKYGPALGRSLETGSSLDSEIGESD